MEVLGVFNESFCSQCKGVCCKAYPGITMPEDWGSNEAAMKERLEDAFASGRWTVDWMACDARPENERHDPPEVRRSYFVRPATIGNEGVRYHTDSYGRCTFLDDAVGCTLTKDERPTQCRMLVPAAKFPDECSYQGKPYSRYDCAVAWMPYQHLLTYYILHY